MSIYGKILMWAGAVFVCLYCSGCATILGGIIGYQSNEMWAGAAIGAALDFGGDIANGLGQMLTDKETRFEQKVSLDSEQGTIELARSDFSLSLSTASSLLIPSRSIRRAICRSRGM